MPHATSPLNSLVTAFNSLSSVKAVFLLIVVTLAFALPGLSNIPVIDRDEARYVQASVQMVESGDYINIRFQDDARNKKPAGVYWLQSAMVQMTALPGERTLWAQRVPSVLGALLAVLATYWGGRSFLSRQYAVVAALLLASTFGLVFEAHIAKTDALLCGFSALTLAGLLRLRAGSGQAVALLVWAALAIGFMIKGPVVGTLVIFTLIGLALVERKSIGLKKLLNPLGPVLFLLLTLPWAILIWQATDGAFFKEAVGNDLVGKLGSAQEKHGGPFGYYSLTLWVFFWPASLFLPLTLVAAFQFFKDKFHRGVAPSSPLSIHTKRNLHPLTPEASEAISAGPSPVWLLLAWSVPFFVLLEWIPTKLPHYPLPIFPALVLLIALSLQNIAGRTRAFPMARKLGAILFGLIWLILAVLVMAALFLYAPQASRSLKVLIFLLFVASGATAFFTARAIWQSQDIHAVLWSLTCAGLLMIPTYSAVLPSLTSLRLADQVVAAFDKAEIVLPRRGGPTVLSPHFTEPSLIYHLGKEVRLGDQVDRLSSSQIKDGTVLILDTLRNDASEWTNQIQMSVKNLGLCLQEFDTVTGLNYSKGDPVFLTLSQIRSCPD